MATDNSLIPAPGTRITADWARRLAASIRAARPVAGEGVKVAYGPNGATISAISKTAAPALAAEAAGIHPWKVEIIPPEDDHGDPHCEIYIPKTALTVDGEPPETYNLTPSEDETRTDWYSLPVSVPTEEGDPVPVWLGFEADLTTIPPGVTAWLEYLEPAEPEISTGTASQYYHIATIHHDHVQQIERSRIEWKSKGVETLNDSAGRLYIVGDPEPYKIKTKTEEIPVYVKVSSEEDKPGIFVISLSDEPQKDPEDKEKEDYCNSISKDGQQKKPEPGNEQAQEEDKDGGAGSIKDLKSKKPSNDISMGGGFNVSNDISNDPCNF